MQTCDQSCDPLGREDNENSLIWGFSESILHHETQYIDSQGVRRSDQIQTNSASSIQNAAAWLRKTLKSVGYAAGSDAAFTMNVRRRDFSKETLLFTTHVASWPVDTGCAAAIVFLCGP